MQAISCSMGGSPSITTMEQIQKEAETLFGNTTDCWNDVWLPLYNGVDYHTKCKSPSDGIAKKLAYLFENNYQLKFKKGHFVLKHRKEPFKAEKCLQVCRSLFSLAMLAEKQRGDPLCSFSIYYLAMKPFIHFIEKNCAEFPQAIEECQKLKFHLIIRQSRQKKHPLNPDAASTVLQRAWRVRTYNKNKHWGRTNELISQLTYSIPLNQAQPPIPEQSNQVDQELAQKWILANRKRSRPAAEKLIKLLCHRSFAKFDKRLQESVESFNEKLISMPPENRKFIIVVPDDSQNKSNPWVTNLALKHFAIPPLDIVYAKEYHYPVEANVVVLDDAAYSGKQLQLLFESFNDRIKNIYLITPFMTNTAFTNVKNYVKWISKHERMLSIPEMKEFTESELKQLEKQTGSYYQGDLGKRTLNWFDHKMPDSLSTLDKILALGFPIDRKKDVTSVPFIPETTPPYKAKQWF